MAKWHQNGPKGLLKQEIFKVFFCPRGRGQFLCQFEPSFTKIVSPTFKRKGVVRAWQNTLTARPTSLLTPTTNYANHRQQHYAQT